MLDKFKQIVYSIQAVATVAADVGAQLSWESICLTSRGSQVRALLFPPFWPGSSVGQNASLSRQRSTVRARSGSPNLPLQLSWQSRGLKILVSLVRFRSEAPQFADVAHLVERHLAKVEVAGSSPVIRSKKRCLPYGKHYFFEKIFFWGEKQERQWV